MLVLRSRYDKLLGEYASLQAQAAGNSATIEVLKTTVIGLKDEKIADLKELLQKSEDIADRERIRADQSVDNLLSRVAQVAPISDPSFSGPNKMAGMMKEMDEMFEEDPEVVSSLIKRIEAGDTSVMEDAGDSRYSEQGDI